jgi:hypothetical protein
MHTRVYGVGLSARRQGKNKGKKRGIDRKRSMMESQKGRNELIERERET